MEANRERLYQHVKFLTELRPFRNWQNLDSLARVCEYLRQEFKDAGLDVTEQVFQAAGNEYSNVIASYNPGGHRRLIVGAHYDVCGDQPGADDNASAVAGLLEVARMVATSQPQLDYRIDFVSYCLEEPPFYGTEQMGSYIHARSIAEDRANIIGVINFEMIGCFHDGKQPYPDPQLAAKYPAQANFVVVVGIEKYREFNQRVHQLMNANSTIDVQMIDDAAIESLAAMSDQRSYWEFDIPGLMINDTSFIRNQHYHQVTDDIDTLNFDAMQQVVTSAYRAVTGFQL